MYTIPSTSSEPKKAAAEWKGLVLHVGSSDPRPEQLVGAFRTGSNAIRDLPENTPVEVAVQGGAVRLLAQGSPIAEEIHAAAQMLEILACENSLHSAELDPSQLVSGITVVPAAVGHLTRRQWQGWAYIRV